MEIQSYVLQGFLAGLQLIGGYGLLVFFLVADPVPPEKQGGDPPHRPENRQKPGMLFYRRISLGYDFRRWEEHEQKILNPLCPDAAEGNGIPEFDRNQPGIMLAPASA